MELELVTLKVRDDGIALITLIGIRPENRQNSPLLPWGTPIHEHRLSPPVVRGLQHCLDTAEADTAVRAVVVVGEGHFWSNGLDLAYLDSVTPEKGVQFTAEINALMARILCFPIPTVAALNGLQPCFPRAGVVRADTMPRSHVCTRTCFGRGQRPMGRLSAFVHTLVTNIRLRSLVRCRRNAWYYLLTLNL